MKYILRILVLASMLTTSFAADATETFIQSLYSRFAFRSAAHLEISYWTRVIESTTPEKAETSLKHFFFVHAAYKTLLDQTVTISEVEATVDALNSSILNYQSVQWALMQTDAFKKAKANGQVGKPMQQSI